MTEEIEVELQNLGVKDDLGDDDSDVTPTNSSPTPPTPPTIINFPPSSNTSGFYENEYTRYSSCDEYDLRSDSSLSWGEDEFEGEATRIVNSLFDQLDKILYNEEISKFLYVPATKHLTNKILQVSKKKEHEKPISSDNSQISKFQQLSIIEKQFSADKPMLMDDAFVESMGVDSVNVPQPSAALLSECKEWISNFPHFRITGVGVDIKKLSQLELLAFEEDQHKTDTLDEEVIAKDGEYENSLQFVTLKRDVNPEKKNHKKTKGPPSRICSGSSDPEVLKEQILIKLFEFLWPTVTQVVEPLLNHYAHFVINQSVQYSSISRESSTKGHRENYHPVHPPQLSINIPPISMKTSRPLSSVGRQHSPIFRLPSRGPTENSSREELQKLLQISSKPLLNPEDKRNFRSLSASKVRESSATSQTTVVSLPILLNHRPVSSKSTTHLLTPRLKFDQRPTSNSSRAKLRFNDKYNVQNRTATIEEDALYDKGPSLRNKEELDSPSPTWSRHTSFLPPIPDVASFVHGKGKAQPRLKELNNSGQTSLSIKGSSLSASSRNNNLLSSANDASSRCGTPAEPFVSWIVSKVDRQSSNPSSSDHVSQHVDNKSNPNLIDKTKYYRRDSHH